MTPVIQRNYSYNINIPTTVSHIWITGEVSAYRSTNSSINFTTSDKVSITISTNTGQIQGHPNYVDGSDGPYGVAAGFIFDMAVSNVSTVTVTFSFYGPCFTYSYGKLTSYRTNLDSDITVCQGTAGFIAIDPNTVPYSVS